MVTISDLKQQQQGKNTELFNKCGLFFAFSNEQFAASKTPLKEGEKYISIGSGGYMPKGNIAQFQNGMKDINNWYKLETKKIKRDHIIYELNNYECFYTGDISDACKVLPYKLSDVQKIYNEIALTV